MSTEYIIENNKKKNYIYATRRFGDVEPSDLFGSIRDVARKLYKKLTPWYATFDVDYYCKYCICLADMFAEFTAGCTPDDIEIHPDDYFHYPMEDCWAMSLYMDVKDVDRYIKEHNHLMDLLVRSFIEE